MLSWIHLESHGTLPVSHTISGYFCIINYMLKIFVRNAPVQKNQMSTKSPTNPGGTNIDRYGA